MKLCKKNQFIIYKRYFSQTNPTKIQTNRLTEELFADYFVQAIFLWNGNIDLHKKE